MVAISAFSSLLPFCTARRIPAPSPSLAFRNVHLLSCVTPLKQRSSKNPRLRLVKAVEEETQVSQQQDDPQEETSTSDQQPLVVPISPSDTLTMFFQVLLVLLRPSAVCYNAYVKTHLIIDISITGLILFPLSLLLLQNRHHFHLSKQQILL